MPEVSYPGVYVQEIPSGVRSIAAVPTSVTAFVGRARRGPVDASPSAPVHVRSWLEYERTFGGLWEHSPMSFAVHQFFQQGGAEARIVRVVAGSSVATASFTDGALHVVASSPGVWGGTVEFAIDYSDGRGGSLPAPLFNLSARHLDSGQHEGFARVSSDPSDLRYVSTVLEAESALLRVTSSPVAPARPATRAFTLLLVDASADGSAVGAAQITHAALASQRLGMYALDRADGFNLMVIPPYEFGVDLAPADVAQAAGYCDSRNAMLLADARSTSQALSIASTVGANPNVACFFPHVRVANPLAAGQVDAYAPIGAVAGIVARTDAARGVWKAPAGVEAAVLGAAGVSVTITHAENGALNAAGVNAIREFARYGTVVWGARTLAGGATGTSDWRYLTVRRLALLIETSITQGTGWVVFEPNDEPLWAQIRGAVSSFLDSLFRQGAFQGSSPREAYFVKCGRDTTTPADVARGRVQVQVGFAPLKPAEFVVVRVALKAARP